MKSKFSLLICCCSALILGACSHPKGDLTVVDNPGGYGYMMGGYGYGCMNDVPDWQWGQINTVYLPHPENDKRNDAIKAQISQKLPAGSNVSYRQGKPGS